MAGAGYRLFNSGDVLTAAQVNTYLMEQTVMVFDDAAARTTALSGVVSEGMISYLKDTNAVEVYNGSSWVASDDPNAIQNTIVDAKGDLISASAADVPARLAVGSNGETLVADSSATTGLRWQGQFMAGKNKIINGAFDWNQRAFSTSTTDQAYGFDRWLMQANSGATYSAQTFTVGTAPVVGYEAKNFARIATTGQSGASVYTTLTQKIESVRTFANQTVVVSFWAKADSGTPSVSVELTQNFGSGGSPSAAVNTLVAKQAITTSWARYAVSVAVPSISGKTLGTTNDGWLELNFWTSAGSNYNTRTSTLGIQTATIDFWGVQIEAGSVATPFTTATGTLAGELAACQRYYQVLCPTGASNRYILNVNAYNSTSVYGVYNQKVSMRTAPTLSIVTGTNYYAVEGNATADACDSFALGAGGVEQSFLQVTSGVAVTQGYAYWLRTNDNAAFAALQAEL